MHILHTFAEQVHVQRQPIQGEVTMATMMIQHKVNDFDTWKAVFDSVGALRTSSGELSAQIFRDASDPNSLTILNGWDTLENAQKFAHSPDLMAAMQKAGVVGKPNVLFLNEA